MKNKILPILFIFILISFLFINNSFAVASYPDVSETVEAFGHLYRKYIVISCDNNGKEELLLWVFGCSYESILENSRFEVNETTLDNGSINSNLYMFCNGDSLQYQSYSLINNEWFGHGYSYLTSGEHVVIGNGRSDSINLTIYDSSYPVYYAGTDTIFSPEIPVTLAGVLAKANPTKTFQTMMRGIIPYLIALVVGLVAFWKAWSILLKELRKA